MPSLTTLSTSGNSFIVVQAQAGGHVSFAALTQITTSPVQLISSGTGSQIDVSALTTLRSKPGFNQSSIAVTTGATLLDGNNLGTVINGTNLVSDATFTIKSNQIFSSDIPTTSVQVGTLVVQGNLQSRLLGTIDVQGNVTLDTLGILSGGASGVTKITGNLLGNTTNFSQFNPQGIVVFDGAGTIGTPQQLEAMSADLGAVQSGFNSNFAYSTLSLSNNTRVKLVDLSNNAPGAGAEAVYVKKLVLPVGTTLDLNGLHLYVRDASQIAGTVVNGTVTSVSGSVIVNRQLFYKGSAFDTPGGTLPVGEDNAIAVDKTALLPGGGKSTFANYSSYNAGINGVMVDITGSHPSIGVNDFTFKVSGPFASNSPSTWTTLSGANLPTVTVRAGGGVGSDRVEIVWPDGKIIGTWLQVTVKADANTGIASADNFYFGSLPGDSGQGNDPDAGFTDATDEIVARNNQESDLSFQHGLTDALFNPYDYNRDDQVDATDQIYARNFGNTHGELDMIQIGPGGPFAPATGSASRTAGDAFAAVVSGLSMSAAASSGSGGSWVANRLESPTSSSGSTPSSVRPLSVEYSSAVGLAVSGSNDDFAGMDDELIDTLLNDLGLSYQR